MWMRGASVISSRVISMKLPTFFEEKNMGLDFSVIVFANPH